MTKTKQAIAAACATLGATQMPDDALALDGAPCVGFVMPNGAQLTWHSDLGDDTIAELVLAMVDNILNPFVHPAPETE